MTLMTCIIIGMLIGAIMVRLSDDIGDIDMHKRKPKKRKPGY